MAEPNQNQVVQEQQHMQIEYVEDKGGAKLKLQVIDGQYYPTFPTEIIKDMNSIRIRPDDVILAGYLKAGEFHATIQSFQPKFRSGLQYCPRPETLKGIL